MTIIPRTEEGRLKALRSYTDHGIKPPAYLLSAEALAAFWRTGTPDLLHSYTKCAMPVKQ